MSKDEELLAQVRETRERNATELQAKLDRAAELATKELRKILG
jgi:hypothetical protein